MNWRFDNPVKTVSKFGYLGDIDAGGSGEEVWIGEGAYPGFVAAAAATTMKSSSADDDAAGSGAQAVNVLGLADVDGVWSEVEEAVVTDGITAVTLSSNLIRAYRMYVDVAGAGETNAGNIDILHGSTVLARIGTGYGQTLQAVYTIPDVMVDGTDISEGSITRWYATVGASQSAYATIALQTRAYGGAWRTRRIAGIGEGGWMLEMLPHGIDLDAKTDIRIRVISNGVNNSSIAAGFDMSFR